MQSATAGEYTPFDEDDQTDEHRGIPQPALGGTVCRYEKGRSRIPVTVTFRLRGLVQQKERAV
jgi:hypothetical protein